MKLHRVVTLFEGVVDRFLAADPNVQPGGPPEPVRFKPPGKAVTMAIVTETLPDDDDKGKRFAVQVKIPERPGFSLEYPRVSRRRIERVQPRLCCVLDGCGVGKHRLQGHRGEYIGRAAAVWRKGCIS
jgi:hypothetical protein